MYSIDLNADIGESYGQFMVGNDPELLKYISSANIACGFHAGDPIVIRNTVIGALKNEVSIGAHPGYPDIQGFGRRPMKMAHSEIVAMIIYQVGALKAIVEAEGGVLSHVKPHGALYNSAATDSEIADAIAHAVKKVDESLIMFGLAKSQMENASKKHNLNFASEVFADRAYNDDGSLVSRSLPGAVIHNVEECIERVSKMIFKSEVVTITGKIIKLRPDTICLHGDNQEAVLFASSLRKHLEASNVMVRPVTEK